MFLASSYMLLNYHLNNKNVTYYVFYKREKGMQIIEVGLQLIFYHHVGFQEDNFGVQILLQLFFKTEN